MRNFSLLLLFLLLPIHHATSQKTERQYAEVHDYFLQHLKGQTATPPAGSFSVKQLDEMRAMVWRAWCEAYTQTRTDLTDPSQRIFTESLDRATMSMFILTFYFE